jgi:uncharacterized protein (TIGR02284 family)
MSTDEAVTKDLIETLVDGKDGYAKGAEKLEGSDTPELGATFQRFSAQRASFANELQGLAGNYGDDVEKSGSVAATLHRGWMSLKDALAGSDPHGVLDAAVQGEDHAVSEYDKALEADISPTLRAVVTRQGTEVKAARDEVRALSEAHSK